MDTSSSNVKSFALRLITAATLLALLAGCAGYVPGRQTYWDARVKDMCERDGGVTVYEKVRISKADIQRGVLPIAADGRLSVTTKTLAHPNAPIYAVDKATRLNERNPRVTRVETLIISSKDGVVVGKQVLYSRFGGDLPTGISEASSITCPDIEVLTTTLHQKLFLVEE